MFAYLGSIWNCRYFWLSLVRIDVRTRYRRSVLGVGWSLLQPLTMTALFCVIVRPLLMPEQPLGACVLFFLTGLAVWNFIVNTAVQGCQSLFRGEAYIRQYPAPLAIYPLRTSLGFGVHLSLVLIMVTLLSCCWHGYIPVTALLTVPVTLMLLIVFGWALATLTGFANVYYQDTQHLCEVAFQVLFYGTPILYGPGLLQEKGLGWLLLINPLVPLFELLREPLLHARVPSPVNFLWAFAVVGMVVLAAAGTLMRCQRTVVMHM